MLKGIYERAQAALSLVPPLWWAQASSGLLKNLRQWHRAKGGRRNPNKSPQSSQSDPKCHTSPGKWFLLLQQTAGSSNWEEREKSTQEDWGQEGFGMHAEVGCGDNTLGLGQESTRLTSQHVISLRKMASSDKGWNSSYIFSVVTISLLSCNLMFKSHSSTLKDCFEVKHTDFLMLIIV